MSKTRSSESARLYKQTHREEILEWQSKYNRERRINPLSRPKLIEQQRQSRKRAAERGHKVMRDPEKLKAQHLVRNAIYNGSIKRGVCCICELPEADAHHEDYSKPRNIYWLCRSHHKHRHMGKLELDAKNMIYIEPKRITILTIQPRND